MDGDRPMRPAAALASIREFFLLEEHTRVAAGYVPDQHARIVALRWAADERLRAARGAASAPSACVLLREGVLALARAHAGVRYPERDVTALPPNECVQYVPDLPPDPADGRTGDSDRVRDVLVATDPLHLDKLDPNALALARIALERTARALKKTVETRTVTHLRALRRGRISAAVLIVLYVIWLGVRSHVLPVNIAIGKPVYVSSYKFNPPDGHGLVDGRPGYTFAVHTNVQDSPNVVIDLQGDYAIDTIKVYNRADGWWDDCLPLVVEYSRDGRSYTELARRETHFGFDVPWVIEASGRMARYVRIRVARRSYLALRRVEIFGRKP